MVHVTKSAFGPLLLALVPICFGYIAAQQQEPARTKQTDQLRDQLDRLQKQVQDLQAAIDDLRAQQQVIAVSAKESRQLVLSTQIEQKQAREKQDLLVRSVGQHDRQIDELGRQLNSMMRDLSRVKTKVGLF